MRERIAKFMYGRYGIDELGKAMLKYSVILCVLSLFLRGVWASLIYTLAIVLIIYMYVRICSKKIQVRYQENIRYMNATRNFKAKFHKEKEIFVQRRYYHFYRCPKCRQRIRIPRGKGRIEVRCPKCYETFIKKS